MTSQRGWKTSLWLHWHVHFSVIPYSCFPTCTSWCLLRTFICSDTHPPHPCVSTNELKAREMTQHEGPPGWLGESDPAEWDLCFDHRVHTEWQLPISAAGEGGGARPPLFTLVTITYKVVVYAPAERAYTLLIFHFYPYMYSVVVMDGPCHFWQIQLLLLMF